MTPGLLIDAIVRQTTVLLATLATASGQRVQVAHVASRVFLELSRELREQGLGTKVIADMFGMALRTYQVRVARLSESHTFRGRSLWEAVLSCVESDGPLARGEILYRFQGDDESMVRGVLRDLVETGLVVQHGRNETATFEVDTSPRSAGGAEERLDHLVQVAVFREGPVGKERLAALLSLDTPSELAASLARLVEQARIERTPSADGETYRADGCIIPFGSSAGWEAAVFDHYQAMVTALVTKLGLGLRKASPDDTVGGSTFAFEVWRGHPMEAEALTFLRTVREQGMALRRRIEEHGRAHPPPDPGRALRVVAYVGQSVTRGGDDGAA